MRLSNGALRVEILAIEIGALVLAISFLKIGFIVVSAFIQALVINAKVAKTKPSFLVNQDIYLYSDFFIIVIVRNITDVPVTYLFLLIELFWFYSINSYGQNRAFLKSITLLAVTIMTIFFVFFLGLINLR